MLFRSTDTWGTITHVGIRDASTGGNLLYHAPLTTSKIINIGGIFRFNTGNLSVTLG